MLQRRGSLILRKLSLLLGPQKVFCALADILNQERDLRFASAMVQALNVILLTAPEVSHTLILLLNLVTLCSVRRGLSYLLYRQKLVLHLPNSCCHRTVLLCCCIACCLRSTVRIQLDVNSTMPLLIELAGSMLTALGVGTSLYKLPSTPPEPYSAPQVKALRSLLAQATAAEAGADLFHSLYSSWSHSAGAVLSLCFLAGAYSHACDVITAYSHLPMGVEVLVQIDRLVQLLETPIFTYLRLQLLQPARYPDLIRCAAYRSPCAAAHGCRLSLCKCSAIGPFTSR